MESDDFTEHYIIRYLSTCELVLSLMILSSQIDNRGLDRQGSTFKLGLCTFV